MNKQIKGYLRFFYNPKRVEQQKKNIQVYCQKNNLNLDEKDPWNELEFSSRNLKGNFDKVEKDKWT